MSIFPDGEKKMEAEARKRSEGMKPRPANAPPLYNGGVRCDMDEGPCACGAWHHGAPAARAVVSGLYFSKGVPSWPLIFRGRGNGAFLNFRIGDRVWCDGIPTGFLLVHMSVIRWL